MTTYGPMRIGDTERDSAASTLSEHYATGRLTKPEYDERLEAIWAAKFDADLRSVFADLPGVHQVTRPVNQPWAPPQQADRRTRPPWREFAGGARLFWLAPLMVIGFMAFAVLVLGSAPWLLFIAFWLFACGGFGRARHGFGHRSSRQHHHA